MSGHRFAGVIIRDHHNRYLTLHHTNTDLERQWRSAGGKIEGDELPIVAAARELWEELGVVALSLRFLVSTDTESKGKTWTGHWFLLGNYQGDFEIQEPKKHSEMLWLTAAELVQFGALPEAEIAEALGRL